MFLFEKANRKIQEILTYKNKVSATEEEQGVSFVDAATTDDAQPIGEELEQKVVLINQLLALLQKEGQQ